MAIAWIDYHKAYDIVPHSWIVEMLELIKMANRKQCERIVVWQHISPLLFVLAIILLTILLQREHWIQVWERAENDVDKPFVNMDDGCWLFSRDIRMEFGLHKIAVLVLKQGIKVCCDRNGKWM